MFKDNPDFFPTPQTLISKMLNKIDWRQGIKSILEPSAGKGDLVEAIHNKFNNSPYHRKRDKYDIDCIEIDNSLQMILKGKGHRLVHDDFLTYNTFKQYDCIIANFPFSEGDKHLLHAINLIELQSKSGQIVALLNAETIRNPYSNIRKELLRKLEEHDTQIEYIQDAFVNSERSTNVETALIYLNIEKSNYNSDLLKTLEQEEQHESKTEYNNNFLIDSDFIKGIVSQYNYEVKAGLKLIQEYNSLVPLMLSSFNDNSSPILKLTLDQEDNEGSSLENAYIKKIRLKYWKTLFSNEQFMSLFTSNLKRKYLEYVEELKDYDFSFFNIYTLRIQLSKEMVQGVEDTILDLFEEFSYKHYFDEQSKNIHYFSGWRTNQAYKVNNRVIIPLNAYNSWWNNSYEPTNYKIIDKLKDVEKVFVYLDSNKNTEDIDITDTLKMAQHYGDTKKIEFSYFYCTFYKKGTCHLQFKDEELLKKFNIFGANKRGFLPPSYGKKSYNSMTSEERDVIDSFEGEKYYNETMKNTDYYLYEPSEKLLQLA